MTNKKNAITPSREENYAEWYQQVIKASDLAEQAPVRGCMVIKPLGYAVWENMRNHLDKEFKRTGHKNAYFPLFIPMSFLQQEADHVDGFAKECAVVTHHKLEEDENGKLVPAGPLEEPMIVRPTSETIIGSMFSKWTESYKDLPILINQWANVVRWEMRTRLFLRTSEFLWQEGHTVHATAEEAKQETRQMLDIYEAFCRDVLAIPVITGEKTISERFPGAEETYTIEAMMQDTKALQAGTSHFLGQNFAKAQNIMFTNSEEKKVYAWTTSWGVSTRLIGALIMTHSDDNGLVLPARIAPTQVQIVPIIKSEEEKAEIEAYCKELKEKLEQQTVWSEQVRVDIDTKDEQAGAKTWKYIKQGTPIIIQVGKRDIESSTVFVYKRTDDPSKKESMDETAFIDSVGALLEENQRVLLEKALQMREEYSAEVQTKEELIKHFTDNEKPGFVSCFASEDDTEYEAIIKEHKITTRCIPLNNQETGTCVFTGKTDCKKIIFAKAY